MAVFVWCPVCQWLGVLLDAGTPLDERAVCPRCKAFLQEVPPCPECGKPKAGEPKADEPVVVQT